MKGEAERVGLTPKMCNEITGTKSMFQHWFSPSQFYIPTKENYEKLQKAFSAEGGFGKEYDAFKRDYEGFRKEYDELKREYDANKQEFYNSRAYFDNTAENAMTDVWHFSIVSGKERATTGGHATPKPVDLCARACKTPAPQDGVVLDLFGGSGSTLIACEKTDRRCRLMELSTYFCDVIVRRWQDFTGHEATLEATGRTFNETAADRGVKV